MTLPRFTAPGRAHTASPIDGIPTVNVVSTEICLGSKGNPRSRAIAIRRMATVRTLVRKSLRMSRSPF